MAIFNSILFNKIRKSIGNITTYELNGQNIVRANSFRRDKKSPAQLAQRARMTAVVDLAHRVIEALKVGYPAVNLQAAINKFVSLNIGLMHPDEACRVTYDVKSLQLSSGEHLPPKVSAVINREKRTVIFIQEHQSLRPFAPDDDRVYGVVWGQDSPCIEVIPLRLRSEPGEVKMELNDEMLEFPLQVYAFTVNVKRKKASTTIWLVGE